MRRTGSPILNLLTAVMVMLSVCAVGYFAGVFFVPNTLLNPFPRPALPAVAVLATPVPTLQTLPNTSTPTPTSTSIVSAADPTSTPPATATEVLGGQATEEPDETDEPTPTELVPPSGGPQFALQDGSPVATIYIPGCQYMGVSGRVFDSQGGGVNGLIVSVQGPNISLDTFTDTINDQNGSYELQLADAPEDTSGVFSVQLFNDDGDPVSDEITFNTFAQCNRNLILVNFVEQP